MGSALRERLASNSATAKGNILHEATKRPSGTISDAAIRIPIQIDALQVEIIKEALECDDQQFVFESPVYHGQPIHRTAMATALRGTKHETNPDKTKTPGLCELLGLILFTPHDLRRTAATLAGELGFSDSVIAKCLDHAVVKDDDGAKVGPVTGIYVQSKRMQHKRGVLDGVAAELRRIIGAPAETSLRLVA